MASISFQCGGGANNPKGIQIHNMEELQKLLQAGGTCRNMEKEKHVQKTDQTSRKEFFDNMCECEKCENSKSSDSPLAPCWFNRMETTARLVKNTFLHGIKSPVPKTREQSILAFNWLTDDNHDGFESDLRHLQKVTFDDLGQIIKKKNLRPESEKLLEAAQVLHVNNWKCDYRMVCQAFQIQRKVQHGESDDEALPYFPDEKEYEETLGFLRSFFKTMTMRLVLFAFATDKKIIAKLGELPEFNSAFNTVICHSFLFGHGEFPWVECYIYNFRPILKNVWLYQDAPNSEFTIAAFSYPSKNRMSNRSSEMPVSVLPRIPKNLNCSHCKNKINPKSSSKLFPLEFTWSRNFSCYPREVLSVEQGSKYSIGVVCSEICLSENERPKYPAFDEFLIKISDIDQTFSMAALEKRTKGIKLLLHEIPSIRLKHFAQNYLSSKCGKKVVLVNTNDVFLEGADTVSSCNQKPLETLTKMSQLSELKNSTQNYFKDFFDLEDPEKFSKVSLDPESEVFRIRRNMADVFSKGKEKVETVTSIRLVYKRKWGMISSFSEKDHTIACMLQIVPAFKEIEPCISISGIDAKAMIDFCFRDKKETLIYPANNSFFDADFYVGPKFVLSIAEGTEHHKNLKSLLTSYDCLIFAHNFDFENTTCDGGLIYMCPDTNAFFGVISMNLYTSYLMKGFGYNQLATAYNRYETNKFNLLATKPRPDDDETPIAARKFRYVSKSSNVYRDAVFYFLRLVLMRDFFSKGKENKKCFPIMAFKHVFIFKTVGLLKKPFTVVYMGWALKQFGNVIELVSHFFGVNIEELQFNTLKDFNDIPAPLREGVDADTNIVLEIEDKNECFRGFEFFSEEKWILFENDMPLSMLTFLLLTHSNKKELRYICPGSTTLADIMSMNEIEDEDDGLFIKYWNKDDLETDGLALIKKDTPFENVHDRSGLVILNLLVVMSDKPVIKPPSLNMRKREKSKQPSSSVSVVPVKKKKPAAVSVPLTKRFHRTLFNDQAICNLDTFLLWKGKINFFVEKQRDIKFPAYVWITSYKRYEGDVMHLLECHLSCWGDELHCAIVDERSFLDVLEKSQVMKNAINFFAIMAPFWDEDYKESRHVESKLTSLLMFLRDDRTKVALIPYFFTKSRCWVFMTLSWDEKARFLSLKVILDVNLATSVLDKLKYQAGILQDTSDRKSEYNFEINKPSTVKSIGTGKLGSTLIFSVVRSEEGHVDLHDHHNLDQTVNDSEGTCAMVLFEEKLMPSMDSGNESIEVDIRYDSPKPSFLSRLPAELTGNLCCFCTKRTPSELIHLLNFCDFDMISEFSYIMVLPRKSGETAKGIEFLDSDSVRNIFTKSKVVKHFVAYFRQEKKSGELDWKSIGELLLQKKTVPKKSTDTKAKNDAAVKKEKLDFKKILNLDERSYKDCLRNIEDTMTKLKREERENPVVVCSKCQKEGLDMDVCNSCGVTTYCSKKCLLNDRMYHEKECGIIHENRVSDLLSTIKPLKLYGK